MFRTLLNYAIAEIALDALFSQLERNFKVPPKPDGVTNLFGDYIAIGEEIVFLDDNLDEDIMEYMGTTGKTHYFIDRDGYTHEVDDSMLDMGIPFDDYK